MEPCVNTPDLFHGRTRTQTAALHPPPLKYKAVRRVNSRIPPLYARDAEDTDATYTIRRIEYVDNPLSERVTPEAPETILEVWEILHYCDPDRCQGVLLKRRNPNTGRIMWCAWDGVCEQGDESLGYLLWEIAYHSCLSWRSSTGWRKDRWPNPPPY